jgi:hypothetical protein
MHESLLACRFEALHVAVYEISAFSREDDRRL